MNRRQVLAAEQELQPSRLTIRSHYGKREKRTPHFSDQGGTTPVMRA
jgi:hypothetical protein